MPSTGLLYWQAGLWRLYGIGSGDLFICLFYITVIYWKPQD